MPGNLSGRSPDGAPRGFVCAWSGECWANSGEKLRWSRIIRGLAAHGRRSGSWSLDRIARGGMGDSHKEAQDDEICDFSKILPPALYENGCWSEREGREVRLGATARDTPHTGTLQGGPWWQWGCFKCDSESFVGEWTSASLTLSPQRESQPISSDRGIQLHPAHGCFSQHVPCCRQFWGFCKLLRSIVHPRV